MLMVVIVLILSKPISSDPYSTSNGNSI